MSVTEFSCPACRVKLSSPKSFPAGKRLVCPYCESRFSLPMAIAGRPGLSRRNPGALSQTGASLRSTPATQPDVGSAVLSRPHQAEIGPIPTTGSRESMSASSLSPPTPDLRKIYRRFALLLIVTIVVLSAGFGTALYFVMKNRPASGPASQFIAKQEQENDSQAKEKEEESRRGDFRRLMIEGGTALGDHRFDEAMK